MRNYNLNEGLKASVERVDLCQIVNSLKEYEEEWLLLALDLSGIVQS